MKKRFFCFFYKTHSKQFLRVFKTWLPKLKTTNFVKKNSLKSHRKRTKKKKRKHSKYFFNREKKKKEEFRWKGELKRVSGIGWRWRCIQII